MAKAAGLTYFRSTWIWSHIEATQQEFNWASTDAVVNAVKAASMEPVAVVGYAPGWAGNKTSGTGHGRSPKDAHTVASFAATAAPRYVNRVAVWEVWNEPNSAFFWGASRNVSDYGRTLKAVYSAIKAVSTSLTAISGALRRATVHGTARCSPS